MSQQFNDVQIVGTADVVQVSVQANATQVVNPIQVWQDSSGNPLAKLTGAGQLQIGNNIVSGPTDALIQVNYNPVGTQAPSVWHAPGVLNASGTLAGTVNWVYHELQLSGTPTLNGVQNALYSKLTNATSGSAGSADLRAATLQVISTGGAAATPVGKATGVRALASNAGSSYLSQAVGVEATVSNDTGGSINAATAFSVAAPTNNGTIGALYGLQMADLTAGAANYALYTGKGVVHVGDVFELPVLAVTPTSTPPSNFIQLYSKLQGGTAQLYAKNSSGVESIIGGGGGGGGVSSVGLSMPAMFSVTNSPVTGAGTLTATWNSQAANSVLAGPVSGTGVPTFRGLVPADLPTTYVASVQVLGTSTVTIASPGATLDGYTMAVYDLLLLTGQTTASQNGLWRFNGAASPLTRPPNYPTGETSSAWYGLQVYVVNGTANGSSFWRLTTTGPVTIDTTATAWSRMTIASGLVSTAPLVLVGQTDSVQLAVRSNTTQTNDLQQWQTSSGGVIARFAPSGSLFIYGQSDQVRLQIKASASQTTNLQEWQSNGGSTLVAINGAGLLTTNTLQVGSGAFAGGFLKSDSSGNGTWSAIAAADIATALTTPGPIGSTTPSSGAFSALSSSSLSTNGLTASSAWVTGQSDMIQMLVKGYTTQTNDLQEWQTSSGAVVAAVNGAGLLTTTSLRVTSGAFTGGFLKSNGSGTGSWSAITSADVATALTTPGPIGSTTPSSGVFSTLSGSNLSANNLSVAGQSDSVELIVQGNITQTSDLQQWQTSSGGVIAHLSPAGSLFIYGQSDQVRLQIKASPTQTTNLQEWQSNGGGTLVAINGAGLLATTSLQVTSGAFSGGVLKSDSSGNGSWSSLVSADIATALTTPGPIGSTTPSSGAFTGVSASSVWVTGQSDMVQMLVKGNTTQTNDLQEWQTSSGAVVAAINGAGLLTTTDLRVTSGAGSGKYLKSDGSGNGSWSAIASADIATALTTPGAIGGTTPSTGAFTTLKMTSGAGTGKYLKSDASGNGSWSAIASADIATALTTPGAIGGTTPSTGAFTTLKMTSGAGTGKYLKSDGSGNGSWSAIASADIATALTTPGAIGGTTPSTGAFTTLKVTSGAAANKYLKSDASGNATWQDAVASVALTVPSFLSVSGSPITTSGTLAVSLANQSANLVFAGPSSGGATAPTFRALVAADLSGALALPPAIGGTTPAAGTFTTLTGTTSVGSTFSDSGTNNVTNLGLLTHNSSGAVTTGLGTGLLLSAQSSTTAGRSQGRVRTQWATATDASRAAKLVLSAFDTAERDGLAIQASGSAPMIGFLGATPAVQQTGGVKTAGATYGSNEQTMLQTAYNALRTFGLLS